METFPKEINVAVIDDEPLVRAGIIGILNTDPTIKVTAEGADGTTAIEIANTHKLDVLLLDIQMPRLSGLEALRSLRQQRCFVACLFVTTFGEDEYLMQAIQEGGDGFVLKSGDPRQLVEAVHAVAGGGAYFSPPIAKRLVASSAISDFSAHITARQVFDRLTAREQEILTLLGKGFTNAEIAATLHLSTGTVKTHVSSILRSTGARNRVEAALLAFKARE